MTMCHLERELNGKGDEDLAKIIRDVKDVYKRRHSGEEDVALPASDAVKERLSQTGDKESSAVRFILQEEWAIQSQKYIGLGFHTEIGLSEEDYLSSLPKFEPQPEIFIGRFDIPVLVETRISPQRQAELANLNYYLGSLNVCDWESDPKGYRTPKTPYTTWMQDGKKNFEKSVGNARKAFKADERGATEYDGIALFITSSSVLNDHYVDLPGTSIESFYAPSLSRWNDESKVDYRRVDNSSPEFGSASCGRVAA